MRPSCQPQQQGRNRHNRHDGKSKRYEPLAITRGKRGNQRIQDGSNNQQGCHAALVGWAKMKSFGVTAPADHSRIRRIFAGEGIRSPASQSLTASGDTPSASATALRLNPFLVMKSESVMQPINNNSLFLASAKCRSLQF